MSHQVPNSEQSVVVVRTVLDGTEALSCTFSKWVGDHAVAGLETNLRLEGVLTDSANHL